jgi:hypothetical protein
MSAWNRRPTDMLSHFNEHRSLAPFYNYVDRSHKPFHALLGIVVRAGVEGTCSQIVTQWSSTCDCTLYCRGASIDSQTWRLFGKKKGWPTRHPRALARMETIDGFCRRMVHGLNAMIFVGNNKDLWGGRRVTGAFTRIWTARTMPPDSFSLGLLRPMQLQRNYKRYVYAWKT